MNQKELGDYRKNRENSSTESLILRIAKATANNPEIVGMTKVEEPRMTLQEQANKKLQNRIEEITANDPRTAEHVDVELEDGTIIDKKAYLSRLLYHDALEAEQKRRNSVDYTRLLEGRLATMNIDPTSYNYSNEFVTTGGEQ